MKKLLAILLTLSLALALAVPAFAVEDEDTAETPAAVSEEEAAAEEQPVTISAPAEEDEDTPTAEELAEMSDFDRGWYEGSEAGYDKGVEDGKADFDAGKAMAETEYPDTWGGETYQEGYDNGYISGYDSGYDYGYSSRIGNAVIVNCLSYASLRQMPDTRSVRLARVPLGAVVTNCYVVDDRFAYCEYGGLAGYILLDNLGW